MRDELLEQRQPKGASAPQRINGSFISMIVSMVGIFGLLLMGVEAGASNDLAAMILEARTASDHEEVARRFADMAQEAKQKAEQHRRLSESYRADATPSHEQDKLIRHCTDLVTVFETEARHYREMAAGHRYMAQKLR